MRETKVICDGCGKEIADFYYAIRIEFFELKPRFAVKDFCLKCYDKGILVNDLRGESDNRCRIDVQYSKVLRNQEELG